MKLLLAGILIFTALGLRAQQTGGGGGVPSTGSSLPSASAAGQAPVSTGPGKNYTAQAIASSANLGVLVADTFTGADIGAKINAAGATLPLDKYSQPTGVIQLQGSTSSVYYLSTPIQLNTLTATLDCQGSTLVWTGSNAAAMFVMAGPLRQNPGGGQALIAVSSSNGGLRNCNIQTTQSYLNSTGTNTPSQPAFVPSLSTIAVNAVGTGYVTGDIIRIVQAGAALGTAVVTASGGSVTGLSILHGGYAYTTGTALATLGGTGTGLTVNVTAVNAPVSCYPYNASPALPTALFLGGDPTGRITGDPSTSYGNGVSFYNVHVSGFCGALVLGSNTWQNQFFADYFAHNYWGVDDEFNNLIANSGERSTFYGGTIGGNTGANLRNDNGTEFTFDGVSFDYSEQLNGSNQWVSGAPIIGSDINADFESVHIEDEYAPVIAETGAFRGYINLHNGDVRTAVLSVPADIALFQVAGTGGYFNASGVAFNLEHVVTNYFFNPTNGAVWQIVDPRLGTEGALPTSYATNGNSYAGGGGSVIINGASGAGYCFASDLCLFRNGSGVLENSSSASTPNAQAFFETGTLSVNGNLSKIGTTAAVTAGAFGVPVVVASPTRLTAQTASVASTNLQCNGGICPLGFYRIHMYSEVTSAGTGGTLTQTCGWTGAAAAQSVVPVNTFTGVNTGISLSSTTSPLSTVCDLFSSGTANITFSTTVSAAVGSPQYDLSVYLERLQ